MKEDTVRKLFSSALAELDGALRGIALAELAQAVSAIAAARRIVAYGVGREGLMMRALAMRLYHLGLDCRVVGDMAAPPVGPGDLLMVSAGPGYFSTVLGLVEVAREAGATTLCITAQPTGRVPARCDHVLTLPAQTMANDTGAATHSVLPMGSLYEGAQYVTFEILILLLRERLGTSPDAMRQRHTNLE